MLPHLAFYDVAGAQIQVLRIVHGSPIKSSPGSLICISLVTYPYHLFMDLVTFARLLRRNVYLRPLPVVTWGAFLTCLILGF